MPLWRSRSIACSLLLGCAVGEGTEPGGYGFGGASATATTAAPPAEGDDGEEDAESSSSGEGDDDGAAPEGSSDDGGTFGPADASSDGGEAGSTSAADPSGGDPGGAQPGAGMYSACLDPSMCPGLDACMQIVDAAMQPTDGFCTVLGCANAGLDCDPSPGGTATPTCYAVQTQQGADAICALDCGGGKSCPVGMGCTNLAGGQVCV